MFEVFKPSRAGFESFWFEVTIFSYLKSSRAEKLVGNDGVAIVPLVQITLE